MLLFWLNIIVIWYYLIVDRNNYDQPNGIMGAHHARDPQKPHNELTEASHNAHGGFAEALQKLHIMLTKASQELYRSFTKCSRGLAEASRKPTKLQIVNIIVILKKIVIWYYLFFMPQQLFYRKAVSSNLY